MSDYLRSTLGEGAHSPLDQSVASFSWARRGRGNVLLAGDDQNAV